MLMRTNRFVCCNLQLNESGFNVKFDGAEAPETEDSNHSHHCNLFHYAN